MYDVVKPARAQRLVVQRGDCFREYRMCHPYRGYTEEPEHARFYTAPPSTFSLFKMFKTRGSELVSLPFVDPLTNTCHD